jgi:hypothetical protein
MDGRMEKFDMSECETDALVAHEILLLQLLEQGVRENPERAANELREARKFLERMYFKKDAASAE